MLTAYERYLLACYLANAASGLGRRDPETAALAGWAADRENRIALGAGRRRRRLTPDYDRVSKEQFRDLRDTLQAERPARAPRRDRTGGATGRGSGSCACRRPPASRGRTPPSWSFCCAARRTPYSKGWSRTSSSAPPGGTT